MMPNMHIHEHLMFERHQELQRELVQQVAVELPRRHSSVVRRLATAAGTILLALEHA